MGKKYLLIGRLVCLVLCMGLLLSSFGYAASWIKEFSSDTGLASFFRIIKTSDGNYILMGSTNKEGPEGQNNEGMNIILVKINESGEELWRKVYGSGGYDDGYGLTEASDGSLVVSGEWNGKAGIIKTDANGNLLWSLELDVLPGTGYAVAESDEGDFIVLAESYKEITDEYLPFISRVDTSGNLIWNRGIGYYGSDFWPRDLIKLPDGQFVYTGIIYGGRQMRAYIAKIDGENNVLWYRRHRPEGIDFQAAGIEVRSFGMNDLMFFGAYDRYWRRSSNEDSAFYVMKMDHFTGNPEWVHKSIHGRIILEDFISGFFILEDGSTVFVGSSYNNARYVKLDPDGNELWAYKYIGINSKIWFDSLVQTSDGGFILVGMNQNKMLAMKVEADGSVNSPYVEPLHETDYDVDINDAGTVNETVSSGLVRRKHFSGDEK